jgi:lipoprotein-anchoring transpeptidase ErfK/SrfK
MTARHRPHRPQPRRRGALLATAIGALGIAGIAAFTVLPQRSAADDVAVATADALLAQRAAEAAEADAAARAEAAARAAEEAAAVAEARAAAEAAAAEEARRIAAERQAELERSTRILVSLDEKRLWLVTGGQDTLLTAPVAIGMEESFTYGGRTYNFTTPRGTRRVLLKETEPVWTPPDWHYLKKAVQRGIEPVQLNSQSRVELSDGSFIAVMDDQVGRINHFGNFYPFTPGIEIIFDDKLFIPPFGTAQRRVPDALGPYKLDTGNGYLIHGTHRYNTDSIGQAVSHGCIRMDNADLSRLYYLVDTGTPVVIF